ncbi:hypothetical protein D3Z51_19185 [Clostridiaceae bacterium]|nr:hypothetical protein [Clostridiaceae bacterium]RKI17464.1 hypothetical protein D7V81_02975 [bacterium 1XD21-70]
MQVNSQDYVVRQYSQNTRSTQASSVNSTSAKASDKAAESATQASAPDVDRVEFSRDTDITKMSDSDRAALVKSLKDDLNSQMSRFTNMMTQTFQKQGITAASLEGDNFWKFMASGNYSVDAKTKAEAQEAISEDGFWGVKQTSQRIFDFAAALAGDDVETMKKMQAAVEKGFEQAGAAWGGDLPSICGDTHTAVNKLFDDYYASH